MFFKFAILVVFVAVAKAGYIAPVAYAKAVDTEYDPNPQYSYSYGVKDALTGDDKSQTETRHGDVVRGQYSLTESDGSKRIVDYSADPFHGFNAVVSKTPSVGPVVAYSAPVAKVAAPLTYSAPVVSAYAAAPVVHKVAAYPAYAAYAAPAVPSGYSAPTLSTYSAGPVTKTVITGPSAVSYSSPAVSYTAHAAPLAYAPYAHAPVAKTFVHY